jgi:hypothetical protein
MRYLFGFVCVLALGVFPLVGCSETTGEGGNGGSGGTAGDGGNGGSAGSGGTVSSACNGELCEGIDCNDDNPCTRDVCNVADGTCSYMTACDDFNDCTTEMCDLAAESCSTPSPVANGTPCEGGTCRAGLCELTGSVLPCTEQGIRNAIAAGDNTYTFACDGTTPVVTQAEIEIDNDVILDGEGKLTVDGDCAHRVFSVSEGVTAELRGFTVTSGNPLPDFTDSLPTHTDGGCIDNRGTLTLTNCTVTRCLAPTPGDPEDVAVGGGIHNFTTMTLTNCTVSDNNAHDWGGGISSAGTLTMTNSTVSGNSNPAVWNHHDGVMTITNSTVSNNWSGPDNVFGHISNRNVPEAVTLTNSLVDGDCSRDADDPLGGASFTSLGHNIESPGNTCGFGQATDQFDVSAAELSLGPLQNNGGLTKTHALGLFPTRSVAIDHVPAADCGVTTDQRNEPRPETGGDACDVGSFERQPEDP